MFTSSTGKKQTYLAQNRYGGNHSRTKSNSSSYYGGGGYTDHNQS